LAAGLGPDPLEALPIDLLAGFEAFVTGRTGKEGDGPGKGRGGK